MRLPDTHPVEKLHHRCGLLTNGITGVGGFVRASESRQINGIDVKAA